MCLVSFIGLFGTVLLKKKTKKTGRPALACFSHLRPDAIRLSHFSSLIFVTCTWGARCCNHPQSFPHPAPPSSKKVLGTTELVGKLPMSLFTYYPGACLEYQATSPLFYLQEGFSLAWRSHSLQGSAQVTICLMEVSQTGQQAIHVVFFLFAHTVSVVFLIRLKMPAALRCCAFKKTLICAHVNTQIVPLTAGECLHFQCC